MTPPTRSGDERPGARTRWAVIGTGSISEQMTADLLLAENAAVAAIASRDPRTAAAFARRFGVESFGTLDDVLDLDEVDAVYIGTPHATHLEVARRAIERGKAVLCEKPATVDSEQLDELIALARDAGVFFMEAMWMKFAPAFRHMLEQLRNAEIGEVRSVRASFGIPFPRDGSSRWRADMRGSALLDQGIYPVTLAIAALGLPDDVTASGVVRDDGVDLSEQATLLYGDGRFAQLASSMVEFVDPSASISGTRGWITVDAPFWAATGYTVHRPSGEDFFAKEVHDFPREGHGYTPMLRAVSDAIAEGLREHPWHTWQQALEVSRILDLIRDRITVRLP